MEHAVDGEKGKLTLARVACLVGLALDALERDHDVAQVGGRRGRQHKEVLHELRTGLEVEEGKAEHVSDLVDTAPRGVDLTRLLVRDAKDVDGRSLVPRVAR